MAISNLSTAYGAVTYEVPSCHAGEKERLAWIAQSVREGETYLQSQRAYVDIDRAIDVINGTEDNEKRLDNLSRVRVNRLKRQIREVVATLANLRPLWGFKSDNPQFENQTEILNKLVLSWWHNTFADRKIREALQYAAVQGTGYLSPIWEKDFWFTGRGDVTLHAYGPKDILPVQIGRDHDLQRAYAVVIRTEVPINLARKMYPLAGDRIQADRGAPLEMKKGLRRVSKFVSPALLHASGKDKSLEETPFPMVDVYNVYIMDTSYNDTGADMIMGEPGANWSYIVPYCGKEIDTGMMDALGRPVMHRVSPDEALLYPRRRLIVATNHGILFDGPSPWWHGKVPLVQFRVDDWAWDFLGYSLVHDGESIQESNNVIFRAIDDTANLRLRPPRLYDKNLISQSAIDLFDTRIPGSALGVDMTLGEPVKMLSEKGQYDVPQWIIEHLQAQEERMADLMGLKDLSALAKARQTPSSDSIEKLMELAGPLVTDMSRNMERSMRELGDMFKAYVFQFYTAPRRVQILGKDGVTEEDFYYRPGSLIPNALPGEDPLNPKSREQDRAFWHMNNFLFHVTPNSMHQITQMTRKLVYLQLWRDQRFPISPQTVAEALDIPNWGTLDGNTEFDKWINYMRQYNELQIQLMMEQQKAALMMQMMAGGMGGPQDPATAGMMGLAAGLQANEMAGQQGQNPNEGRPPSGGEPPQIQQKDGGSRTTIAESR
jgi:hypothetical protein